MHIQRTLLQRICNTSSDFGIGIHVNLEHISFNNSYAYTVVGEFVAWIIGLALSLEVTPAGTISNFQYTLAAAAVARGWSGYLRILFDGMGVNLPICTLPVTNKYNRIRDHQH